MEYSHTASKFRKVTVYGSIIAIILVTISVGTIFYVTHQHTKSTDDMNNITFIKKQIGLLYLLPTNEEPALATVTDKTKLASNFAGKVEDGDKILIYEKNGKAIVYRPSINKIVDVEPVQIDNVDTLKK
jgi:hypothetical protein